MTEQATVVLAERRDAEELYEHLRLHHTENDVFGAGKGAFPPDEAVVRDMVELAFSRNGAIIGVIRDGDRLAGSIFILISKLWWTSRWHLEELWTFVHPDFRNSNHARDLHKFAKECATKLNMPLITAVITNTETERKARLYQRAYGYPVGVYFFYDPGQQEQPKPNGSLVFWDNPFPRPGVSVIPTAGLSKREMDHLSRWGKQKSREAPHNG